MTFRARTDVSVVKIFSYGEGDVSIGASLPKYDDNKKNLFVRK